MFHVKQWGKKMTIKEVQDYVYNFFKNKGLPHITICSIMGNIQGENSTWNIEAVESDTAIGFGLCQWSYGRRTQLEAYGTDLQSQCEFLWSELTGENLTETGAEFQWIADPHESVDNGAGFYCSNDDFLKGNGTIDFLTTAFCYCWERPAYATNHLDSTRIPYAKIFDETYKNGGSGGSGEGDGNWKPPTKRKGYNFVLFGRRYYGKARIFRPNHRNRNVRR